MREPRRRLSHGARRPSGSRRRTGDPCRVERATARFAVAATLERGLGPLEGRDGFRFFASAECASSRLQRRSIAGAGREGGRFGSVRRLRRQKKRAQKGAEHRHARQHDARESKARTGGAAYAGTGRFPSRPAARALTARQTGSARNRTAGAPRGKVMARPRQSSSCPSPRARGCGNAASTCLDRAARARRRPSPADGRAPYRASRARRPRCRFVRAP